MCHRHAGEAAGDENMALLNYLTDEETKLVMEIGVKCPNPKSLADQLRYGIVELAKQGYEFKGVKVEDGKVVRVKSVGAMSVGPNKRALLDEVMGVP